MQGYPVVLLFMSQISIILWKAACKDVDFWNKVLSIILLSGEAMEEVVKVIIDMLDFF